LPNKCALNPCLAGNVIALGDDYSSSNGAIVKRLTYGLEVVRQTRVVSLEAVRAVEAEFVRIEVRVGFRLISSQDEKLARLNRSRPRGRRGLKP
jgi:hypothetical protein